jgi:hypothetical protein
MTFLESIARQFVRYGWSPVGKTAWIAIDDSADQRLSGLTIDGTVRAFGLTDDGTLSRVLIQLRSPIAYHGHYRRREIRWVVGESCLVPRRISRLPLSWCVVRVVDAPSFADSTYDRTIGIARLTLVRPASQIETRQSDDDTHLFESKPVADSLNMTVDERVAVHLNQILTAGRAVSLLLDGTPCMHQLADVAMVGRQILTLAEAVVPRLPPPRLDSSRDPELAMVLAEIENSLQSLDALRGSEYERALGELESLAGPYALSFVYEIRRLDEVLA